MLRAYPIILSPSKDGGFVISIPSFDISTQAESITDSILMARDAIGILGIDMEDDNKEIPDPINVDKSIIADNDIVTYVDVDFAAYRESVANRGVKKNCTIPKWLNNKAEKAGVNFSKVLQDALVDILDVKSLK
jgi:predicted RNase H-like HicB family nuclease